MSEYRYDNSEYGSEFHDDRGTNWSSGCSCIEQAEKRLQFSWKFEPFLYSNFSRGVALWWCHVVKKCNHPVDLLWCTHGMRTLKHSILNTAPILLYYIETIIFIKFYSCFTANEYCINIVWSASKSSKSNLFYRYAKAYCNKNARQRLIISLIHSKYLVISLEV